MPPLVAAASTVTGGNYLDFLVHLVVDAVAVLVLAWLVYYRRHGRRDLLTAIVGFNISLFVVLAVIDVRSTSLGVGFGLFALLSIINLRSDPFSTIELTYFFAGLVIGVVNALEVGGGVLDPANELFAVLLTVVLLLVVFVIDHPRLGTSVGHQQVTLDRVIAEPDLLAGELERRLGARVTNATVLHTDYVQDTMLVDVRFRRTGGGSGGDDVPLER